MSTAPQAEYFKCTTGLSRPSCTWLREHYRRFTDPKTGAVQVECVSVYADGFAYLSGPYSFGVPARAGESTAAAYSADRYQALRAMARRRAQHREEKAQRQLVEEMRRDLAALATTPAAAPKRNEASLSPPAVKPVNEPLKIEKLVEKPVEASLPMAVAVAESAPVASQLLGDFTVLDLEFQVNDMLELAAIRYQNWEPVGEVVSFVRFTGTLYRNITELTGISALHVYDAPEERAVLERFKKLAGDSLIVCHSIGADKRVLEAARTRQGAKKELPNPWLCTLALAKRRVKAGILPSAQKCGLGELCHHFNIKVRGAHRAKADVLMTTQLLRKLHEQQPITKADLHGAPKPGKASKSTVPAGPGLFANAA